MFGFSSTFLLCHSFMAWWRSGYCIRLATKRSQVRVLAAQLHVTTLDKLFTVTRNVPLFTKQYKLVLAIGWEGNCRSGVTLADSVV